MDFIITLPFLEKLFIKIQYNNKLIIIDKFIKYAYFLLFEINNNPKINRLYLLTNNC